jgi:hypothetical protein
MKNISFLFALTFLFLIGLGGCSSNGEEFVGTWHKPNYPNNYLVIEHLSGKDYSVTTHRVFKGELGIPGNDESSSNNFSFQDGKLVGPFNISIVYSNNKLSYNGEEYIK